jgi:hypothetical protein
MLRDTSFSGSADFVLARQVIEVCYPTSQVQMIQSTSGNDSTGRKALVPLAPLVATVTPAIRPLARL